MTMQTPDTLMWEGVEHYLPDGEPLLGAWPRSQRLRFKANSTSRWRGFFAKVLLDDAGFLRVSSATEGYIFEKVSYHKRAVRSGVER